MTNSLALPDTPHFPVMLDEVISICSPKNGGTFVDCTFGGGGYSKTILPYKINGEVQHGWSPDHGIMIPPNYSTKEQRDGRHYVFNKFNKKKSNMFGFKNVYAIGAPFIYISDIYEIYKKENFMVEKK